MPKRVKLSEVARIAGVSTATVDRVLHGRGGYSARSYNRVTEAINQLGYGLLGDHLVSPQKRIFRFKVFLPSLKCAFQETIIRDAELAAKEFRDAHVDLSFGFINLIGGEDTVAALREVDVQETDGICLFAVDAPGVRSEINRLVEAGVTVCTIVSDVPSSTRMAYIGLDNVAAGRTAGRLMHRMATRSGGSVAIITGSNEIRDHLERTMGLNQAITMYRPDTRVLPPVEGHSIDSRNADIVERLLQENDDLVGIYSVAGGSVGIIEGLRRAGKPDDLLVIVHELEPLVREALIDGTLDLVLHQNTRNMMRIAMRAMVNAHEGQQVPREALPIELYVAENLP